MLGHMGLIYVRILPLSREIMIPLLEKILFSRVLPGEGHATLVGAIILGHLVIVGAVLICLAMQDTRPDWLKAKKEKPS